MEAVADVLESYRGRDRLVRTLGYSSRLLGGLLLATRNGGSGLQRGLLRLSQELSNCRATLRLFDDLAMLMFSREYGLGASEEDAAVRWLSVVANVTDQLYYPCEHLAWAADYKILSIYSNKWWTLSNILWSLSLALGVIRELKQWHMYQVRKRAEILNVIGSLSDLANAVHWMPVGFLWAGHFPEWLVGLMGTISSLIGLYQMSCMGNTTKDP
ncbi:peroxisomal membrane protein 11C isoform X3 [Narcine bancroftii]|uniref:peroxisomal membrane protein 11C isoform X3 n=1 Tax=Narcine bancroftii TaxID=1343680 RepID=UPI0038319F10